MRQKYELHVRYQYLLMNGYHHWRKKLIHNKESGVQILFTKGNSMVGNEIYTTWRWCGGN